MLLLAKCRRPNKKASANHRSVIYRPVLTVFLMHFGFWAMHLLHLRELFESLFFVFHLSLSPELRKKTERDGKKTQKGRWMYRMGSS
jgi:hypothetical protein